ncbi:MAG: hypothetical protein J3K34DRAFT_507042 [Monoraphidium minutum]|nr:MAG: hypothetical protein J3K34DRAFT_507042 [Monoraphidium minutum]
MAFGGLRSRSSRWKKKAVRAFPHDTLLHTTASRTTGQAGAAKGAPPVGRRKTVRFPRTGPLRCANKQAYESNHAARVLDVRRAQNGGRENWGAGLGGRENWARPARAARAAAPRARGALRSCAVGALAPPARVTCCRARPKKSTCARPNPTQPAGTVSPDRAAARALRPMLSTNSALAAVRGACTLPCISSSIKKARFS